MPPPGSARGRCQLTDLRDCQRVPHRLRRTDVPFDFYRITKISEALDIGFYDYIDSGCLCIMEWPENIEEILPEETLRIHITVNPDESRTVSWED